MDYSYFDKCNFEELKDIALKMDIKIPKSKSFLKLSIIDAFKEYESYKKDKIDKYKKLEQIGNKGKEGITYLVETNDGLQYAMKTFKKTKSSDTLKKEAMLQQKAADFGLAPKVIDTDTVSKYIVMEKLDTHLLDYLNNQKGIFTQKQQKQIIQIFKGLDKSGVFHGDSNILNYMYKNNKLYIIDFGFAKEIDSNLVAKLKTKNPNIDIMTLGFILKLKEMNCPAESYSYLLQFVKEDDKIQFKL
jgi:tRNA A-37 threonylcarbamoyl transferase component Bud32